MLLDRWKTACAKLKVAMYDNSGYDAAVSGGRLRRSRNTGELGCIKNLLLSHWRQSFCLDVILCCKRLALALPQVQLVRLPLGETRQQGFWWVAESRTVRKAQIANLKAAHSHHNYLLKGMLPAGRVPFCLPKA